MFTDNNLINLNLPYFNMNLVEKIDYEREI